MFTQYLFIHVTCIYITYVCNIFTFNFSPAFPFPVTLLLKTKITHRRHFLREGKPCLSTAASYCTCIFTNGWHGHRNVLALRTSTSLRTRRLRVLATAASSPGVTLTSKHKITTRWYAVLRGWSYLDIIVGKTGPSTSMQYICYCGYHITTCAMRYNYAPTWKRLI
jgi:hypothetical protein